MDGYRYLGVNPMPTLIRNCGLNAVAKIAVALSIVLPGLTLHSYGQTINGFQLWTEFHVHHGFANVYSMDNRFRYLTNFESPKFQGFQFAPNIQRALSPSVDVFFMPVFYYNHQNDTTTTFEIRPSLGAQFHFTPGRRVLTTVRLMFEQRNVQNIEKGVWQQSTRTRIRLQVIFPITHASYFENGSLYFIADAEWFIVVDKDVNERYANRLRFRAGLGHRLNSQWRFEVFYTRQNSRSEIGGSYFIDDDIVRITVRYYTKRVTPTCVDPNG